MSDEWYEYRIVFDSDTEAMEAMESLRDTDYISDGVARYDRFIHVSDEDSLMAMMHLLELDDFDCESEIWGDEPE